jgi:hypothetical protein
VVEHLDGETLIYDLERDEAHHLNPTAATVFELCDGRTTVADLAARATERLAQPVSPDTVSEALEQLTERKLLDGTSTTEAGVSRREVIRKAALVGAGTAAAAPLIKSIVAPTPALAQSPGDCLPTGAPCEFNNPQACCSTTCCAAGLGGCDPNGGPCCCDLD